jgi:thiamine-monophosphate kinase
MRKVTRLEDVGEFGFIRRIARPFLRRLPASLKGIGDDCAVIELSASSALVVTTDMLVEGTHFIRDKIAPSRLGRKSLAVSLSDIAAMGGRPCWAFISLALTPGTSLEYMQAFYSGLRRLAQTHGVRLLGGDTTRSRSNMTVDVMVIGLAHPRRVKLRSGARAGDIVAVTDCLGDSEAGLRIILEGLPRDRDGRRLVFRHLSPVPQLAEGSWLAGRREVTAMMDVSDGLASDIMRIMESSACGADIDLESLPVSDALRRYSFRRGWDAKQTAASGGEDYCLLLTAEAGAFGALRNAFERKFGRPLYAVGRITAAKKGLRFLRGGRPARLEKGGYDHFRAR